MAIEIFAFASAKYITVMISKMVRGKAIFPHSPDIIVKLSRNGSYCAQKGE